LGGREAIGKKNTPRDPSHIVTGNRDKKKEISEIRNGSLEKLTKKRPGIKE